ncbi:mitochondrial 54S ribosomal protein YmL23 [Coccidioides immitis RS]|uniref:Large ribosomal subunit protein uL13m n=7 Tax=Coccidioides TaxID=5500 RepID=J3KDA4_COCIM|nr:mitochondrial 54S ribosomal protein YmL23 [Coccidioides immitis RS]XP_003071848.1 mitochondrial 54S ribosomal protein YmL23 [Coccidioides posadasii C735 delta SOWgp]EFW13749.1 50S ribosomal protein L13 [Coccidioides posadasii str. Silveira]KMM69825.1 50S ribosomal protein L13 [Coccidioides posadasii RMSCC 3488]KMP04476.1 54S ribosomal protein L23 [Coccidioides immitis RMSCC 2394]KMU76055.1 50S ribosomal protein L13 [Coccidioides immitis RMSCC 3703]KMU89997.1 54S ribosomal protein L23 [Cocc|eukprot:XP_003071848.1 mitochondrial 54S ribosomal protein YmL23 [Coccidioides posadasii C735 delta SOWgp]
MSQSIGRTRLAYSRTWHYIDVGSDPRSLGRVASSIALFLMGKNKPIYDPSTDCGDYVVAVGCKNIHTTGKKRFQKLYYSHSTRPGSLKSMSMDKMFEKWGGAEVLKRAVRGMLPKNKLREKRMARLKAFEGHAHPYKANIVQFGGKSVLGELPEIKKAFQRTREVAAAQ